MSTWESGSAGKQQKVGNMGSFHFGVEEKQLKNRGSANEVANSRGFEILAIEIDRGCDSFHFNNLCSSHPSHIPLYKYNEVPGFLRGNPYVVKGYRALLPFSLCCRSLFVWSNETVNIWTHLLGFLLFFGLMLFDNVVMVPTLHGDIQDHIIISIGLLCFQFCMLCSTGFHLFGCHSERASRRWLALDLAGILVGLIGCYLPAVHYAFYCMSIWREFYFIVIAVLSLVVLCMQFHPQFLSSQWNFRRAMLFCAMASYGIMPVLHWVFLNGGLHGAMVQIFIPKVTVMYLLGGLAFFFYWTKFPERCFPGYLDYIGSSHQWWHVILVAALLWWNNGICDIFKYRMQEHCFTGSTKV